MCFLYFWFIVDCWLFQQKLVIEMIKLNFFLFFFLFVFSFEVVFIPFRRSNSLGLPNFGFRVLLLCMQSLLCWHCFAILVFSNFSVPCTTDDHLYATYYPGFLAPCTTAYDHLYYGYYPEWGLHYGIKNDGCTEYICNSVKSWTWVSILWKSTFEIHI